MKAVCVNADRKLEVREVPAPVEVPAGHLLVDIEACAINHGDKAFLANPGSAGGLFMNRGHDVWGASGAGTVKAVGDGVSEELVGRSVAIYRSLSKSPQTIGLWCEQALVPRTSCVVLPETVAARDYAGSLVNVMTAHAFLEEIAAEGHTGVIVTAGSSATGLAMGALARRKDVPVLFLARSAASAEALRAHGFAHVLATDAVGFNEEFARLAAELNATAVFDGVGGELTSRIAPLLAMNSVVYFYGFLGAAAPVSISTFVLMAKNLVLRRFSNFNSATVADESRLAAAIAYLEGVIGDPLFRTRGGKDFGFEEIDAAMAYEATPGAKAVLVRRHI